MPLCRTDGNPGVCFAAAGACAAFRTIGCAGGIVIGRIVGKVVPQDYAGRFTTFRTACRKITGRLAVAMLSYTNFAADITSVVAVVGRVSAFFQNFVASAVVADVVVVIHRILVDPHIRFFAAVVAAMIVVVILVLQPGNLVRHIRIPAGGAGIGGVAPLGTARLCHLRLIVVTSGTHFFMLLQNLAAVCALDIIRYAALGTGGRIAGLYHQGVAFVDNLANKVLEYAHLRGLLYTFLELQISGIMVICHALKAADIFRNSHRDLGSVGFDQIAEEPVAHGIHGLSTGAITIKIEKVGFVRFDQEGPIKVTMGVVCASQSSADIFRPSLHPRGGRDINIWQILIHRVHHFVQDGISIKLSNHVRCQLHITPVSHGRPAGVTVNEHLVNEQIRRNVGAKHGLPYLLRYGAGARAEIFCRGDLAGDHAFHILILVNALQRGEHQRKGFHFFIA